MVFLVAVLWMKFKKKFPRRPQFWNQNFTKKNTSRTDPTETVYEGKKTNPLKLDFI